MADTNYFEDFPKTEDEAVKEWIKNASPTINQWANIGSRLTDELTNREKVMDRMSQDVSEWSNEWENTLELLKTLEEGK